MAKAICNVTTVRLMDTLQETARNRDSQRVTEKEMLKDGRKETLKEKAKERTEPVTIVGRKDIWRTVVGKAKDGQKEMLKAKAKVSNGVGKAKVLTKLTTVSEKPKWLQKLTLVQYG